MYRKVKKIPTVLALFLLLAGVGAAVFLDKSSPSLTLRASKSIQPEEVHFSNINESSFTVSWITTVPSIGSVLVNRDEQKFTFLDDLDSDNIPRPRTTHYITVKNLNESATYSVKVISGNQNCSSNLSCPTYTQQTAVRLDSALSLPPAHGTIFVNDDKPAEGAIVYLTIGKSAPLSSRVDSSGLWVIPLTNLRNQDLLSRPIISDNDIVQITAQLSPDEVATAVVDIRSIRQNLTIPKIILGNSYNFIDLISKKDLLAKIEQPENQKNILGITSQSETRIPTTTEKINVLFPKNDGDSTPDNRPRLRGMAPAGSLLLITVNSTPQTGKITVNDDGTWSWRPPKELPAGIHNLNIQGYDQNGNLFTVTRQFIVLKSGESVLGESTPSASLTPSPIITVSPTVNLTPTATPVTSPTTAVSITPSPTLQPTSPPVTQVPTRPPTSGSTGITVLLVSLGAMFLVTAKLLIA